MTSLHPTPGRVFAHVGQAFPGDAYDYAVVGGGRLGLACAFYLRRFAPKARVLVVERGGIPSEEGAALHARGVWHRGDLPSAWQARAEWVHRVWQDPQAETGIQRPHDPGFRAVGWAEFLNSPPQKGGLEVLDPDAFLAGQDEAARRQLRSLLDFASVAAVRFDPLGGCGRASTLALAYGYGAVRLGADLLLNAEARLTEGGVEVRRLDITPRMEVVVAQVVPVRAGHTVVAAGSEGPALLEADLGIVRPHGRAFAQFPRLALPPAPHVPVLARGGFTLRPDEGGWSVLPPPRSADPAGYVPRGGRLTGVPVGVRREVLDDVLLALEDWPAFAGGRFDLGKAPSDVAGTWEARPRGGWPLWEEVARGVHLLLGGPEADRVGLAVALDLAAHLAGERGHPWDV